MVEDTNQLVNLSATAKAARSTTPEKQHIAKTSVTVIIPCYNEAEGVHYTCEKLFAAREQLAEQYDLFFVFVDDASSDDTVAKLEQAAQQHKNFTVVRHQTNQGITGAILTGLQIAQTEVVCSLDADCTYDPASLGALLALFMDDTDMVTASPYHPAGTVENVPGWRLWISQWCSFLYRRLLKTKLYTYTSCFRVYRRSSLLNWQPANRGFVGLVEMISFLEQNNARIVECPATLSVRQFGQSKMRILRVISQHLRMMWQIVRRRTPPRTTPAK
jgi:glycosyltransferase involved in cell wall biosynthesis